MIRKCTNHRCKNPGQDKLHKKWNRVMNYSPKKGVVRCTVCGMEYTVSDREATPEK